MTGLVPFKTSAVEIARSVQNDPAFADAVLDFYLKRANEYKDRLNCFLYVNEHKCREQLEEVKKDLSAGKKLPLAGVPVVVKDNISTRGFPTTCGSRILERFAPVYDATVVQRLRAAGAIILAKANMDEFAMGSSNENSAFGPVKNPWNTSCVPGGSSGGSAACVAADLSPLSLGSDTGGSIRQPASLCGLYGFKPTYGSVSRYGLVAYGSSLDQIGPFARNINDLAVLSDVIRGYDECDSTSVKKTYSSLVEAAKLKTNDRPLAKLRIGLVKEFFAEGLDDETRSEIDKARAQLEKLGCQCIEVSIPSLRFSTATYYVVATAEASSNLARYDGIRYGLRAAGDFPLQELYQKSRSQGFGREVKQRIMLGTYVLSSGFYDAYYAKALSVRRLISQEFEEAFSKVDLLLSPTSPTTAFKIGEKADDPLAMYLSDICTIAVNLAGVPALSLPCGFDRGGLPVGMQFIGPMFCDERLIATAAAYESVTNWWKVRVPNGFH